MIVVTGAAGFIGSQIIRGLNAQGVSNILAVGDLTDGKKFYNLVDCDYLDFMDYEVFLSYIQGGERWSDPIEAMFHEGACSDTTEWDGRYMMRNNYEYTKILFHYCLDRQIPFLYASSAAVYGSSTAFKESETQQRPLNVYGYSKWAFDQYMLRHLPRAQSQVVGFRYFNVYGPHEQHKGRMASVAFHFMNQLREQNAVRLFEGSHGYENGEQLRDFVSVADVVRVNLWFLRHPEKSGIFNLGTGKARSFNDVARILIDLHGRGRIQYIPFPDALKSAYQSFTQADLSALRAIGYTADFDPIEVGLADYHAYQTDRCRVELFS